jgi:hypothetical protein
VNHTPGTATADDDGDLDPSLAAELLDQATQHANRTFTPGTPALFRFRAVIALVIGGGFWLSVRHQYPYTGPTAPALAVALALVAINIGWSAWLIWRASAGVSGPFQRKRNVGIGILLAAWVLAYVAMAPLYHPGPNSPAWGLYPAGAPLMIVGLIGTAIAVAFLRDRTSAGVCLVIAIVGAAAGFGGPARAWLIMGVGLSAVCLGYAALTARRQERSMVRQ